MITENEFRRLIPEISQKVLTEQLRDLEDDGLVNRKIYKQVPPMVEYSLTKYGEKLMPILEEMDIWGKKYIDNYFKEAN